MFIFWFIYVIKLVCAHQHLRSLLAFHREPARKKKRWVHHHWNSSFSNKLPRKNLFGVKMLEFFLSVSNENYYFQRQFHALFTIFLIPLRVFFRSSGAVIFMAVGWNTQFSVEQSTTYQTIFRFSHFFLFRLVSVFSGKMVDDNNYTFK